MQQQFPLGAKHEDKVDAMLALLREHLPRTKPIIIRPNPRFLDEWKSKPRALRDDWTVSSEGKFHDILPEFSALVSVNSTCISEAITLGMPVAVLGVGCFSGSDAVLDCSIDPERLASLLDWRPEPKNCGRYAKAVLGRHFMPYQVEGDPPNIEFERWMALTR